MIGLAVPALWAALIGAVGLVATSWSPDGEGASVDSPRRYVRIARTGAATAMAGGCVVAAIALGRALWTLDLSLTYVADHARGGTSAPYRLAGLWGGAGGSLLLFTAMVAVLVALLAVADGPATAGAARIGAATVAAFVATILWLADPFERLAVPAIDGGGLQPILEHPAMLYHPPILYLGLVSTLVPFLVAMAPSGPPEGWRRSARRSLGVSLALLTSGLATGANWAYVELGWGGYWGWDPVENGSLVPWLLIVAALHGLRQPGHDRRVAALCALPWMFVLVGTAITRAGIGGSVHAFADDDRLGWALLALIVATAAATVWRVVRIPTQSRRLRPLLAANLAITGCAAFVVAVGVLYPIPASGEPLVSGHFYATLLGPLAVIGLALCAWALGPITRVRAVASAAVAVLFGVVVGASTPFSIAVAAGVGLLVAAIGATVVRRAPRTDLAPPDSAADAPGGAADASGGAADASGGAADASARGRAAGARRAGASWATRLGHIGLAVLLVGVAGSTEGERVTVSLQPGDEVTVGGQVFRHAGVEVVAPGDGASSSVRASVELLDDGAVVATMTPELVAYTERSVLLAETALRSSPRRDVQVVLRTANDDGAALYEIGVVPLTWWVWWGAIVIAASGLAIALRGVRPLQLQRRA